MNQTHLTIIVRFKLFIILFCYVFAFYLKGISVSILIGFSLWGVACFKKTLWHECVKVVQSAYIKNVILVWSMLVMFSIAYPLILSTYDLTFFRLVGAQGLHLFSAIPVFAWLSTTGIHYKDVERYFGYIFIAQTFIQIVVLLSPTLGTAILAFNRYDPDGVAGLGSGIRGKALSAATTYHLTMAYGIAFIIYIKNNFKDNVSPFSILGALSLFVGIFFAGRSGFVACLIGALGFLFYPRMQNSVRGKIIFKTIIYLLVSIALLFVLIMAFAPDFMKLVTEQILPYAFEFLYSVEDSGEMQTASTNRLQEMWQTDFTINELLLGTGHYTNPDGSFYKHVDPGILRHMLFMGIVGYGVLVAYQLVLLPAWKMKSFSTKYYYMLILLFLFGMEYKCINIGVNKFAFSISLLLTYSYFYLGGDEHDEIKVDSVTNNSDI